MEESYSLYDDAFEGDYLAVEAASCGRGCYVAAALLLAACWLCTAVEPRRLLEI